MMLPDKIGRYAVNKLLGRGGQGAVMLALDTELNRRVAIKLLNELSDDRSGRLAKEARIVSALQHPNIVTLFDVGMYHERAYLVLEFIKGESLQTRIERQGALSLRDSVILFSQILAGVAYLHENDIVHRDLSPANILIGDDGTPKVMDFGLSVFEQSVDQTMKPTGEVAGTLRYMAPETLKNEPVGPGADVFALGAIFYEMSTGKRLFSGETAQSVMAAIVGEYMPDLEAEGISLDPKLLEVLNTALQRSTSERYSNAREMKSAFDLYRLPRHGEDQETSVGSATIEYLLQRIERKAGFSSLSAHIGKIYELTAEESNASTGQLVNVLAKDISISQRILTMANSALTGRAQASDLVAAVRLLGLNQVRNCVTNLLLERQFELGSVELREALLTSFHSAVLAKLIAPACGVRNAINAFTCAMFHTLGRTLTIHYLPDDFDDVVSLAARLHSDELTQSRHVFGVAFHELGMAVGARWNLTADIIDAMRPLARGDLVPMESQTEKLQVCAAFANAVSQALGSTEALEDRDARLDALIGRSAAAFELNHDALNEALEEAASLTDKYARMVRLEASTGSVTERLSRFVPVAIADPP